MTERAITPQTRSVHCTRALLDILNGRFDEAHRRLVDLQDRDPNQQAVEITHARAQLDLWQKHPGEAAALLKALLDRPMIAIKPPYKALLLLSAARAQADSSAGSPGTRNDERLAWLRNLLMGRNPFGVDGLPIDQIAAAQWHAELARLQGTQSVDLWIAAAVGGTGKTVRTTRLTAAGAVPKLRSPPATRPRPASCFVGAARDARQHIPLRAAIQQTAGGA